MTTNSLRRSSSQKILGGVCGGIAEYSGLDVAAVRIVTALVVLLTGVGPLAYLLAWVLLPLSDGRVLAKDWSDQANDWYGATKSQRAGGTSKPNPGSTDPYANPSQMPNADDLR